MDMVFVHKSTEIVFKYIILRVMRQLEVTTAQPGQTDTTLLNIFIPCPKNKNKSVLYN